MRLPVVEARFNQAQTSEQALIQSFWIAFEKQDMDGLARLWNTDASEFPAFKKKAEQIFASSADIKVQSFKLIKTQATQTEIWFWLETDISGNDKKTGTLHVELDKMKKFVIHCRKQSEQWKIHSALPMYDHLAILLLSANSEAERQAFFEEYREFVVMGLAVAINARGTLLRNSNPPDYLAAIKAYRQAYDLAFQFGEKKRGLLWQENIGLALVKMAKPYDALREYEQGLATSNSIGERESASRFLNKIADVATELGNYQQAQAALEQSLRLQESLQQSAIIAETELQLGRLEYLQGNYDAAFIKLERSRSLREELLQQTPQPPGVQYSLAQTYNNLGILHSERGDYVQALRHFEKARALSEVANRGVENLLLSIGQVYEKQGNPELAIEYYQKDLAVNRARDSKPAIAQSLINIGQFHLNQKAYEEALSSFQQALQVSEEIGHKDLCSKAHNLIGAVHLSRKNYAEALKRFGQSLALREEIGDREGIADTSHFLSLVYLEQNDLRQAAELVARAANLAEQIGKPELSWRISTTAGRIHLALNQPDKAQIAWQQAVETIESLRDKVAGEESQSQTFFENKTAPYLALTELLFAQSKPEAALDYAERAKGRALLDVLQSGKRNPAKAMTAAEQGQERKLRNEIVSLNAQLYREQTQAQPNQSRAAGLTAQLNKARLDYEASRTRLYAAHPELKVHRGEARTLSLADAAELLPDQKTALLEYVLTPERGFLFVLTKAKTGQPRLRVYSLSLKRDELAAQVEQFRGQLAERNSRFGKLASALYGQLMKAAMTDLPAQAKLVIVPDGPLWELPFQALMTEQSRYLLEEHVISYAPSLTVLREMAKGKHGSAGSVRKASLLAIGDPKLGGQSIERVQALMGTKFEQLPEARTQVEALRKYYDADRSKVFIGEAATEQMCKAEAGTFDILHFATHGILNDRNPLYSHLLLAQPETAKPESKEAVEDGLLEAWEIMQMDLHAELAVLSACETARGRVSSGEGMIGLTWALFVAGVPTTIVSQWQVRSDSTAALMVEFHRLLQKANAQSSPRAASDWTKAEALQQAALKLLRAGQYRHPFYWAGFVLVGKAD